MEEEQGTLEVLLRDTWGDPTASYELSADGGAEIVARSYEDELEAAYREVILEMRHALALAFCTGKMAVYLDGVDNEELAKKAIASFSPDELTITDEDIPRAHYEEVAKHDRAIAHAERMIEFIESQKAHEGENLTTREAAQRAQEGEKRLRKIVGDEEK